MTLRAPRVPPPLEKYEQQAVATLLRLCGFKVRSTSQYRASHVAVGIPDLILHHPGIGQGGWWEVKRYRQKGWHPIKRDGWVPEPLRPEQEQFMQDALRSGQLFGWGGRLEAEIFVLGLNLARRAGNGGIIPSPGARRG